MKMSDAMAICYGGQPQLEPLIREQREREEQEALSETPLADVNAGDPTPQKAQQ